MIRWMLRVTQINLFPIKGCGGYPVESAGLESRGFEGDRRFLLVNERGHFLSQRKFPKMALIRLSPADEGFLVESPDQAPTRLPATLASGDSACVSIWRDQVKATRAAATINDWFSKAIGIPCQLVYMNKPHSRRVKSGYGRQEDDLSFADGAPVMLISMESLGALNQRLEKPVEMERFRPNLVVTADAAFAEDSWQRIRVGEAEFEVAWPCSRCVVPTIDPATGERDRHGEPLRTLRGFRSAPSGVTFGQNLIPRRLGRVPRAPR